ncbi:T-complex protein 1 subunit delta [Folsomia candida]|uniref:T-complex protein 1 subunit delta n=1 Tax=Folsomia candida TaxID=158441 RepID=A0A226E483_FOLCA|nr:T-complex protein 1 subunit delta [Folsomia candida]OXA51834.1 T-complex protein 1 subunit delta [Folsomia candida]
MVQQAKPAAAGGVKSGNNNVFKDKSKPSEIRGSNIQAAKAVADAIRTSLGPRGMDKMIQDGKGDVTITNDGATILKQMNVMHPAAKMLVELSKAQDTEAGDGTTSVVVLAGSLLEAAEKLLMKGLHPTAIAEGFRAAGQKAVEIIRKDLSIPVDLTDTQTLQKCASTSLNSKVVSQQSSLLAPIAVEAVFRATDTNAENIDLKDIRVTTVLGGTVEDTELIDGLLMRQKVSVGPKRIEKAKIALIQFCVSPPKTDMDMNVIVSDYAQMDRVLREERNYILNIVKKIKSTGCTVLLIQKSILRDSLSDLAQHFLDKVKIMTINNIEREEIEFICKSIGCRPIASLDHFTPENMASAETVEEISASGSKLVKISGIATPGKTVSIMVRGSNKLVLQEAERSLHDALCVVRCLVKERGIVAGGGAPETELSVRLAQFAMSLTGPEAYCFRAFAESLEVIPLTLAENAGMPAINTVTELRKLHAEGHKAAGLNVKKGAIANIMEENVIQPSLVTISAINLATEFVASILKIDDVVNTVR